MTNAIAADEVELMPTPLGKWFWREELMAKALETWPLDVIEEALGDDAVRVLPHALRNAELRVRLRRHHIAMIEYRAGQDQTTISGGLGKELDGIASIHAAELFAAIPGFAAAFTWPRHRPRPTSLLTHAEKPPAAATTAPASSASPPSTARLDPRASAALLRERHGGRSVPPQVYPLARELEYARGRKQ